MKIMNITYADIIKLKTDIPEAGRTYFNTDVHIISIKRYHQMRLRYLRSIGSKEEVDVLRRFKSRCRCAMDLYHLAQRTDRIRANEIF